MIRVLLEGPAASPTRTSIRNKTRRESPGRVVRSKSYINKKSNCRAIDMGKLFSEDRLTIEVDIKGTDLYTCTLSFSTFLENLRNIIHSKGAETVTFNDIQRALLISIDDTDNLEVNCTCPDWIYRYKFWATQSGFNYGTPQNDNGKEIRNPNNDIGSVCKHLFSLLNNKSWLTKVSSWLNDYIKRHPKSFAQALDIPEEALTKNMGAYYLAKAKNAKDDSDKDKYVNKWRKGLEKNKSTDDVEEEPEEEPEENVEDEIEVDEETTEEDEE